MHKYYLGVIAILLGIIVFLRECDGGVDHQCPEIVETITKTDTIPGDSIPYRVEVKVPVPYKVIEHDTIWRGLDTLSFIQQCSTLRNTCLAEHHYLDTLKDDSSALIVLEERVWKNAIIDRDLIFQNRRVIGVNHTTINKVVQPKFKVYMLGSIGGNMASFESNVGLGLMTKNDHWYYATIRPTFTGQPIYNVGAGFKIRLKKK